MFHHGLRLWGETTEATDDDNATARQPAAVAAAIPVPATPRARRKRLWAVNGIAWQFGGPSWPIGHLVTGLLARGNASFNLWLVHELGTVVPPPATVIEPGCGPGTALRELLTAYPAASVVGVDRSPVVLKSARRRNVPAIAGGRLTLVTGGIEKTVGYTPACLPDGGRRDPARPLAAVLARSARRWGSSTHSPGGLRAGSEAKVRGQH